MGSHLRPTSRGQRLCYRVGWFLVTSQRNGQAGDTRGCRGGYLHHENINTTTGLAGGTKRGQDRDSAVRVQRKKENYSCEYKDFCDNLDSKCKSTLRPSLQRHDLDELGESIQYSILQYHRTKRDLTVRIT